MVLVFLFGQLLQTVGNPFIRLVVPLFSHDISGSAERCGLISDLA